MQNRMVSPTQNYMGPNLEYGINFRFLYNFSIILDV